MLCWFFLTERAQRNVRGSRRISTAYTVPPEPTTKESFRVKYPEPQPKSMTVLPGLGAARRGLCRDVASGRARPQRLPVDEASLQPRTPCRQATAGERFRKRP